MNTQYLDQLTKVVLEDRHEKRNREQFDYENAILFSPDGLMKFKVAIASSRHASEFPFRSKGEFCGAKIYESEGVSADFLIIKRV